jgi:uncharacterized DUF497 family protein
MRSYLTFEWDDDKLAENIANHGLHFETVKFIWKDPYRIIREDDSESNINQQPRYQTLGKIGKVLFVVYAEPNEQEESIRLISARIATPTERRSYYGKNTKHSKDWRPAN